MDSRLWKRGDPWKEDLRGQRLKDVQCGASVIADKGSMWVGDVIDAPVEKNPS